MLGGDIADLIWFKDELANLISFSTRTYNMPARVSLNGHLFGVIPRSQLFEYPELPNT